MKKLFTFLLFLISTSIYCQKDTVSVVTSLNSIIVNRKSKVLYEGITNRVEINVPNSKHFVVSADGLKKESKNIYSIVTKDDSLITISINITLKNNFRFTEKHSFLVKKVSKNVCLINNIRIINNVFLLNKNNLQNTLVSIKNIDENLNFDFRVVSFKIQTSDNLTFTVKGDRIIKDLINNFSNVSYLRIFDIKFISLVARDALFEKIEPLTINLEK